VRAAITEPSVLAGQRGRGVTEAHRQLDQPVARGHELQGEPGVHDVLRRGAIVDPSVRPGRQSLRHLADEREDRVADGARRLPQGVEVDRARLARGRDRIGVRCVDQPGFGLRLRECGLHLKPSADRLLLRPQSIHRLVV
jgi:hypothetical protein